jgi:hypothetical protein
MTSSRLSIQETVFIIESPSPRDVLDERAEGDALSSALRLAKIPNHYYRAYDLETFKAVFMEKIASYPAAVSKVVEGEKTQKTACLPLIHISAHGNKSGLQLTSGEFVSWNDLRVLLVNLAQAKGFSRNGISTLQVCFSTCMGASAEEMFACGKPYPCFAIVGPTQSVEWSDSLTAFITFYHQLMNKPDASAVQATRIMNEAAGLCDIFVCTQIPEDA